ncbi:hypothetical protein CK203_099981 [Vitis vinifera]|uniref:Reverse transcriptase domain-containing protein n=1 Tax=Vitis vinifera TaxID=29760 RepID=A0A438CIQ2_VITVI|nr:hypothetical protein CK203_099981 [Vitis vinifera]
MRPLIPELKTVERNLMQAGHQKDDTLIVCDASKENLEHLSWVFMWFEPCSWLKINLEKSELILIRDVPNMEEVVEVLGCKVGALLNTYLGLPLGAPYKSSRI